MSGTPDRARIVIVAGPTASGKSALALALALALNGTVINADSMQVYRDLPILTAQPDAVARSAVPHRLYGEIDAATAFSAGAWRARALAEIAAATAMGRVPILVGGTGLYLKALLDGLAPIPPIPDAVRTEARARHAALGPEAFHAALRDLDPETAARLHPGDTQRLLRAYEVVRATGRGLTHWQGEQTPARDMSARMIVLLPPREALYAACDARFLAMMAQGAVGEVWALLARDLDPTLPAMRALGVREIASWLRDEISREAAIAAAQQATRNYAKRQYTWFRHQMTPRPGLRVHILDAPFSESSLPDILSFLGRSD